MLHDVFGDLTFSVGWKARKNISLFGKDYVKVEFKNGSRLDVVAARNSTRGGRRHGGLIEEVNKIALIYLFFLIRKGL